MRTIGILVLLIAATNAIADVAAGRKIYEAQCALCHGQNAGGGRGPSLTRPALDRAPDDAALRKVISEGIEPEMPGAWQLSPREVASVAEYVKSVGAMPSEPVPGDAARGASVYRAQRCNTCHMVNGEGSGYGPELTDVGARRNAAYLAESIVKPASSLPDKFLYVEVASGGRTIRGVRANEDTFSIQVREVSGRTQSFSKSGAVQIRKLVGETPMPAYSLRPVELTDLVAYLSSLRGRR
jgi:putative heme-binding domain-containing protein